MGEKHYDPVALGIMWDKLLSVADEVFTNFYRACFSLITRESFDLVSGIMDSKGRLLAQATFGPPSFFYALQLATSGVKRRFPEGSLAPGDIVTSNDPWTVVGHLHDLALIRPIFQGDKVIAYSGTISHMPDIGGSPWSPTKNEIYEEGIRIPPLKLVEAGKFREDILDIFRYNVRTPEQVLGDIRSGVGANLLAERLIKEFIEDFEIEDFNSLADVIIIRSEADLRSMIAEIPPGRYRRTLYVESPDEPVKVQCAVTVKDGSVTVDFSGSSPASRFATNAPIGYTRGYTCYAVKCLTTPNLPNNQGSLDPVEVLAPEGSILNAKPPSAVGARNIVGHFSSLAVWGALSDVLPERVMADAGMNIGMNFYGRNLRGNPFSVLYQSNGGSGARNGQDGLDTVAVPGNVSYIPLETFEGDTDLLIEKKELVSDSAGPGKFRGGLGQVTVIRNTTKQPVLASLFLTKTKFPPQGFLGGFDGARRRGLINGKPVAPQKGHILKPRDVITLFDAGGGGFYDPKKRPKGKVLEDVKNGYISPRAAVKIYRLAPEAVKAFKSKLREGR